MGRPRLELHEKLVNIISSVNQEYEKGHCYYRKPSSSMKYPCILYNLDSDNSRYADDSKYLNTNRYSVILIDDDPDSIYVEKLKELPYASLTRTYEAEGLNHFVFTIFY